MLESSSSQSSSSKRSKNRTCEGLKTHCTQRPYLRAQLGVTVRIGRKELIISIAAEGSGGRLLGVLENWKAPRESGGEAFPRDRPCLCPSDNHHFCPDSRRRSEEMGKGKWRKPKSVEGIKQLFYLCSNLTF